MADDGKINCTKLPHEDFLIRGFFFNNSETAELIFFKQNVEQAISKLINTKCEFIELKASGFSSVELNESLKTNTAQINLLLYNKSNLKEFADFAYIYNNTFHNSPNILICGLNDTEAASVVKQFPAFDLCVYNNDYNTLTDILIAIRNRTYDDQPIDLTVFKNMTHKALLRKSG